MVIYRYQLILSLRFLLSFIRVHDYAISDFNERAIDMRVVVFTGRNLIFVVNSVIVRVSDCTCFSILETICVYLFDPILIFFQEIFRDFKYLSLVIYSYRSADADYQEIFVYMILPNSSIRRPRSRYAFLFCKLYTVLIFNEFSRQLINADVRSFTEFNQAKNL